MIGAAVRLAALLGTGIAQATPVSGGDLSTVLRLRLDDGRSAIAKIGPLAAREAGMLRAIAATGAPAPEVMAAEGDLLVMAELASDGGLSDAWGSLAAALRRLHAPQGGDYGRETDHGFGAVAIPNGWRSDWASFWADNRLRCHLAHLDPDLARRIERLADTTGMLLPDRPAPALLHGDLWGGNVLVSHGGVTGLIDPACYIGDREVDVAMLTIFDSPPPRFLDALDLEPGWRVRLPVYRLWPLLVHLRLFGAGYAGRVSATLAGIGF